MNNVTQTETICRFDANDEEIQRILLAQGEAICFSRRSPRKKTPNEDALAIIPVDDESCVLIVADGLGGMPDGEKASKTTLEFLIESIQNRKGSVCDAILKSLDAANEQMLALGNGSGTTVAVAEITGNRVRAYHAGDSLIMLVTQNDAVKYYALPHSPIGYALACGAIREEDAMKHPERNLVSNYIGDKDMYITVGPMLKLAQGDTLLLASDAVPDNLYTGEIRSFMFGKSISQGIDQLIQQCQLNMKSPSLDRLCHPDDLTLVGFRYWT